MGISNTLNNMGSAYLGKEEYDQALKLYQQSLKIKEKLEHNSEIGNTLNNIAQTYYEEGEYEDALYYILQAHEEIPKGLDVLGFKRSLHIRSNIEKKIGIDDVIILEEKVKRKLDSRQNN